MFTSDVNKSIECVPLMDQAPYKIIPCKIAFVAHLLQDGHLLKTILMFFLMSLLPKKTGLIGVVVCHLRITSKKNSRCGCVFYPTFHFIGNASRSLSYSPNTEVTSQV